MNSEEKKAGVRAYSETPLLVLELVAAIFQVESVELPLFDHRSLEPSLPSVRSLVTLSCRASLCYCYSILCSIVKTPSCMTTT